MPLVAVCLEHTFGPDCSLTCDDCQNGATCNAEGSGCHCPAGWTGLLCNQSEWQLCALLWGAQGMQPCEAVAGLSLISISLSLPSLPGRHLRQQLQPELPVPEWRHL